jgi:hypothetical protein
MSLRLDFGYARQPFQVVLDLHQRVLNAGEPIKDLLLGLRLHPETSCAGLKAAL